MKAVRYFGLRVLFVLTAVLIGAVSVGYGQVIYVDDDANGLNDGSSWVNAYKYLQDALADANTGEKPVEIRVAQGIYKPDRSSAEPNGTGDRIVSFELTSGITLKGGFAGLGMPDPNARDIALYKTILSGDLSGNDADVDDPCDLEFDTTRIENCFKVVVIYHATNVQLDGMTISGGYCDVWERGRVDVVPSLSGAGVFAEYNGDLTLKDCTIVNNYSAWGAGGGRFGNCTTVQMEGCDIAENSNGGVSLSWVTATISKCVICRNYNGGISFSIGSLFLTDCVVRNNTSFGCALGVGEVSFERCIIEGNSAQGGIASESGTHKFIDCRFYNNIASVYGGAISIGFSSNVDLHGCVFTGNHSQEGGAIYGNLFENLNIENCTFSGNKAANGSFLLCKSPRHKGIGGASIVNSIITDNGNEITTDDVKISLDYSLLSGGPSSIFDPNNNVTWGVGNISLDPCFTEPGHWDLNNTPDDPNDDFFVVGDYHLKSQAGRWDPNSQTWVKDEVTSLCIDAGDPMSPIGEEPFPNGGRINMGAYGGTAEASKSYFGVPTCETIIAGDINGDCKIDFEDLSILALHWLEER